MSTIPADIGNPVENIKRERLRRLYRQRDGLLTLHAPHHPAVLAVRDDIEDLENELEELAHES